MHNWGRKFVPFFITTAVFTFVLAFLVLRHDNYILQPVSPAQMTISRFLVNRTTGKLTKVQYSKTSSLKFEHRFSSNLIKQIPRADCTNRNFLVYKCVYMCGGLADRQRGIITSFLLALLTNRTFILDMKYPCDIEHFLQPNIYDWTKCKTHITNAFSSKTIRAIDSGNNLQKLATASTFNSAKRVLYIHTNMLMIDTIRKNPNVPKLTTWLVDMPHELVIRFVMYLLFQPKDRLLSDLALQSSHVGDKKLACTHIRYGTNPSVPRDGGRGMNQSKVNTIFNFLQNYNDVKKYVIYVATDNLDVRQQAKKTFANILSTDAVILHIDRPHLVGNQLCEGFYSAIFEQYLLSKCDIIVLTPSGFGAMAAYSRGHSDNLFYYNKGNDTVYNVSLAGIKPLCDPI